MSRIVQATFDGPAAAKRAVHALVRAGAPPGEITVAATSPEVEAHIMSAEDGDVSSSGEEETSTSASGPMTGAAIGAVAGAFGAVPVALAMPVAVPAFVLLSLGSAIMGAMGGSVAGAILGAGYEIRQNDWLERELSEGRILVSIHAEGDSASAFEATLAQIGGRFPGGTAAADELQRAHV